MDIQFSAIYINDDNYKEYTYEDHRPFLYNLSRLNIFIGKNNSGKSRLLRKFFSDEDIGFLSPIIDITTIDKHIDDFIKEFEDIRHSPQGDFFEHDLAIELNKLHLYNSLKRVVDYNIVLSVFEKLMAGLKNYQIEAGVEKKTHSLVNRYYYEFKRLIPATNGVTVYPFDKIYIPTLRGLRPIQTTSSNFDSFQYNQDNYFHRTVYDYFKNETKKDNKIYTGLGLFEDLRKFSHGNLKERYNLRNFEKFLSETFFENAEVELIPRYQMDVVYVKIGSYEEPIYNLGDGIQSLIVLTYPLFFNQGKVLKIFIEEPELHLHPGYQRIFIETLLKPEFSKFQYFITTHSNHFLDITLDDRHISVYTFEQIKDKSEKPQFLITNVENTDTNILSLIGVQNSSVFLSNCTIWVEGITDRIYLRKYLEIFQRDKATIYNEDTHFSFVEYGGNNITHWSFLDNEDNDHPNILVDRLCGKLFLVTDRDNAGFNKNGSVPQKPSKKAIRFNQLSKKLNNRFYCLKCREIENLLSPDIIQRAISVNEKKPREKIIFNAKYENYKWSL